MQVNGPLRKELRLALQQCYPSLDDLGMMVLESLGIPLQNITPPESMPTATFKLIEWAIARGRFTELVQKAAADNLHSREMQDIAAKFSFAKSSSGEVERVLLEHLPFENVAQWLEKLSAIRQCVCRVEPQPGNIAGYGTGFLIGPDVVLTNYHVREFFADPAQVVLRFDYETDAQGIVVNIGKPFALATDGWSLANSPENRLDYALLRLAKPAVDDPIDGGSRGFIKPQASALQAGEPVLILQHPNAEPLKLSIGSVRPSPTNEPYLLYTANTLGGSSGSPCLSMALETVALHHYGLDSANRGVLWSHIEADLRDAGKLQLVG